MEFAHNFKDMLNSVPVIPVRIIVSWRNINELFLIIYTVKCQESRCFLHYVALKNETGFIYSDLFLKQVINGLKIRHEK